MIELTPVQKEAKKYIEWLMDPNFPNRGVGRTYLMSVILIERAIAKPGLWIPVWDHGPHHPKKEDFMLERIADMIEEHYPEYNFKIHRMNRSFCMEKK